MGPTQVGGTAEGNVPPDQAHHLITTFGILGCAITGSAAAVATLRLAPAGAAPAAAFAVLAFNLAAAILIGLCGHTRARRKSSRRKGSQNLPRRRAANWTAMGRSTCSATINFAESSSCGSWCSTAIVSPS
jgi:hypothetical protein